jgi:hypothetical protein
MVPKYPKILSETWNVCAEQDECKPPKLMLLKMQPTKSKSVYRTTLLEARIRTDRVK